MFTTRVCRVLGATACLVVAGAAMAGCSVQAHVGRTKKAPLPSGSPGHYVNTSVPLSFDYPKDWPPVTEPVSARSQVGPSNTVAGASWGELVGEAKNLRGLNLDVRQLNSVVDDADLDEALKELDDVFAQAAGQAGGVVESNETISLGGRDARHYRLDVTLAGTPFVVDVTATVYKQYEVTLTCQAEPDRFDAIQSGCALARSSLTFSAN